jgi:formiminoglutamase
VVISSVLYSIVNKQLWSGRIDDPSDLESYRWHQLVQCIDLNKPIKRVQKQSFCFLGFKSDTGVQRNLGRQGAVLGPDSIRQQMANLPSWFNFDVQLLDAGDIVSDNNLEEAQEVLAMAVKIILQAGMFPVLLGGGHEIAYGHYLGIRQFLIDQKMSPPAIINIDAHFDMRPYPNGGSSGTMFHQIADLNLAHQELFKYLVLGIQQSGNTKSLFNRAESLGAKYVLARDISEHGLQNVKELIYRYMATEENIYLTLCSDVFSSAFAPGVSAPQPFGMNPEMVLKLIKYIALSGKLISFDVAEVAPRFDNDHQTAKLASIIIFALLNTLYKPDANLVLES